MDVHVVDRQGMPVSGLDVSNFQVFENGERVQPVNFYEVVREDPDANAPIWLVLYFDQHNMLSANRDRALTELEVDLPAVLEDRRVRVMVAAHDQKPEVVQDFTRNWGAIRGALDRLRGQETVGDARDGFGRARSSRSRTSSSGCAAATASIARTRASRSTPCWAR